MSTVIENKFNFPPALVEKAVVFPQGAFVEVDDLAFNMNNLGRKIIQTHRVDLGGRQVSVANLAEGGAAYELVLREESPRLLGTFDTFVTQHSVLFLALQEQFGGSIASYTPMEMVVALNKALAEGVAFGDADQVRKAAAWARIHVRRVAWVLKNRTDAFLKAPIDWSQVPI